MSKKPLCARCYKAPEGERATFDHYKGNADTDKFDVFCSEKCMHHSETPVEECARLGIQLMNADLMFHMFLSIGREDDLGPDSIIQRRRVAIADRLQVLSALPEVKEILL